MAGYVPRERDCLLIPFGHTPHLFVVMNDPCDNKNCLLVMLSSIRIGRRHDLACVLDVGDHQFIRHASYIVYRTAECTMASHISNMVEADYFVLSTQVSIDTYNKIANGIYISDDIRPRILQYAKANNIDSYTF